MEEKFEFQAQQEEPGQHQISIQSQTHQERRELQEFEGQLEDLSTRCPLRVVRHLPHPAHRIQDCIGDGREGVREEWLCMKKSMRGICLAHIRVVSIVMYPKRYVIGGLAGKGIRGGAGGFE